MAVLENIEPKAVFHWFEALSAIPRGSGNTAAVSAWLADFAKERNLPCQRDAAGNVLISAPASPGYEQADILILQGHMDMVAVKTPECTLDMEREGLDLAMEDGMVLARGTSLGGDDGIAVAATLAVLDDPSIPHPPLEALFTVDEEIGMLGAAALDPSPVRGRQMLNMDTEEEAVITVGCAGGCTTTCTLPVTRAAAEGEVLRISVWGLSGGHSGTTIHRRQANANVALGRILKELSAHMELRLIHAEGGEKDNAVPVSAWAEIVTGNPDAAMHTLFEVVSDLREQYEKTDPDMTVDVTPSDRAKAENAMDAESTERVLRFLMEAPNGVQAMSADLPGLVETSLNLGILRTEAEAVSGSYCVRSSRGSDKESLVKRLETLSVELDGAATIKGDYPAWEYRPESPLREHCVEAYRTVYGREPRLETVHAGLECGILCGKLPGLDCAAVGPDIYGIHTFGERMPVASVQRFWAFLIETLKRCR